MHELSIAMNIIEIACEEVRKHGDDARVEAVHLKLGALSGVVADSLRFAWELACEETPAAGSRLVIEEVPVRVWCAGCGSEQTISGPLEMLCPACGAVATDVRSGSELELTALEIGGVT